MKQTFSELIGNTTHHDRSRREQVEWSNGWYDEAKAPATQDAYLFIGDCMVRTARSGVAERTGCPVDLFGSSSAMHDVLFVSQIDSFMEYARDRYRCVVIQMGAHWNREPDGTLLSEESLREFRHGLSTLCRFALQYTDRIVLLSVNEHYVPPKRRRGKFDKWMLRHGYRKEQKNEEMNVVLRAKNRIIQEVASTFPQATFYDFNHAMEQSGYLHIDHVHYEDKARRYLTDRFMDALEGGTTV